MVNILHIVNADSIDTIIEAVILPLHIASGSPARWSVSRHPIVSGLPRLTTAPAPGAAPHWSLTPRCAASHWSISRGGVRQWPGDLEHKHWPAHRSIGDSLHYYPDPLPFVLWTLPSIQPVSLSPLFEFDYMRCYLHLHRHTINFKQSLGQIGERNQKQVGDRN